MSGYLMRDKNIFILFYFTMCRNFAVKSELQSVCGLHSCTFKVCDLNCCE